MQQQCEAQAQDLEHKEAEISALKAQLTSWRSVKDAEAARMAASNKQLTQQLSQEIARSKTLDGQTSRLQAQLVRRSGRPIQHKPGSLATLLMPTHPVMTPCPCANPALPHV